ncbi:CDP-glycerol glycerophosphotransferase family protein [Paludibacter sp. 221]|uniref:CDP-glycerol glycerophosphotransferase family protein n=1 Tax=Paludibacter sp. 221 TaxID=2302939 RepID=UPI0013D53B1C|nr:CDP-glycerol glycerophosphotransferase family protein [Paludibacter sp. 221]
MKPLINRPFIRFLVFFAGYILYPVSFLVPRRKKKWAFGSFRNAFNDNAKYLFIYAAENNPNAEVVWISADKNTVQRIRDLGLKSYFIGSFRGVYHALTSRYWFFNAYTTDILFFASGGAVCTNLWHGLPLKRIEFNIKGGSLSARYVKKTFGERFFHPEAYRRPDYVLSTTDFVSARFAEAFRVGTSQCLNIAYPRNTILLAGKQERISFIKKYEQEETLRIISDSHGYENVYIYMPTWRESQADIFSQNMDINRLNELMRRKNSLLLLKPHANTKVDINLAECPNVLLLNNKVDIYTILPYTDVLITDYSSVLYDYILMDDKDVILYLYDYDEYANNRDFNFPFLENVAGRDVYDFAGLIDVMESGDYKMDENKREEIISKFWGVRKSDSVCKTILEAVM